MSVLVNLEPTGCRELNLSSVTRLQSLSSTGLHVHELETNAYEEPNVGKTMPGMNGH